MPSIKKIVIMVFLFSGILLSAITTGAQVPQEITKSLKTGNSKVLSEYFNQNVELVVLENDNVYSKAQAQQIVDNFFSANSPINFTVSHELGREGSKSVIGNLSTKSGTFRVYFLLKQNNGKNYIHQLRIEKLEESDE